MADHDIIPTLTELSIVVGTAGVLLREISFLLLYSRISILYHLTCLLGSDDF